jgi:hypothetical protein
MDVIEGVQIRELGLQVHVETEEQKSDGHYAGTNAKRHAAYEPKE